MGEKASAMHRSNGAVRAELDDRARGLGRPRPSARHKTRCDVGRGAIRDDVEPPSGNRAPRGVSRVRRAVKAGRSSHLDTVEGEDASVRADTSSAGPGSARPDPSSALLIAGGQEAGLTFGTSDPGGVEATSARRRGDRRAECHGSHT